MLENKNWLLGAVPSLIQFKHLLDMYSNSPESRKLQSLMSGALISTLYSFFHEFFNLQCSENLKKVSQSYCTLLPNLTGYSH